ncbi:hypothetical protein BH10PAT1_BH10PAT1_3400 [soil metagenome]
MRDSNRGGYNSRGGSSRSFGRSNDRFGGGERRSFGGERRSFGGDRGGDRQMYDAVCDNCGKPCKLPFQPRSGKPVFCSDCFEKMGGQGQPRPERSSLPRFERSEPQNNGQMDALNAKLDKIIELLTPKEVAAPVVVEKKVKVAKKTVVAKK